jgi:S-ribosylhomocysteine lyase LuxS involved in autoinducer biosynthesis
VVFTAKMNNVEPLGQKTEFRPVFFGKVTLKQLVAVVKEGVSAVVSATDANMTLAKKTFGEKMK